MRHSEWAQVAALLVLAVAVSLAAAATVAQFAWPVGLAVFAVLLFGISLLVEWKSGGGL